MPDIDASAYVGLWKKISIEALENNIKSYVVDNATTELDKFEGYLRAAIFNEKDRFGCLRLLEIHALLNNARGLHSK